MKTSIKYLTGLIIAGILFTSCDQEQGQSLDSMLADPQQQAEVLSKIADNHDLSKRYVNIMLENDHTTGMMVDGLVSAAAADSILARKISDMITQFPDLMLMTVHHFLPVINDDKHMCDEFCAEMMDHDNISQGMCVAISESDEMDCH